MSRKLIKIITSISTVCLVLFLVGAGLRLSKEALVQNAVVARQFERLDKTFMNQLKINDALSDEMKEILKEAVRTNPDLDWAAVSINDEEIFSAQKTDAKGAPLYPQSKNLLLTRTSKPYLLAENESFRLSLRFRVLSSANISYMFFFLLMAFILLSAFLAVCALIPLRRKNRIAVPLNASKQALQAQPSPFVEEGVESEENVEEECAPKEDETVFFESEDEEEEIPVIDIDEPFAEEENEDTESEMNDEPETDGIIDLNFKHDDFPAAAEELIDETVAKNENCILLMTEFTSLTDERKDPELRSQWEATLTAKKALFKTERKKTIAVFPRCTLTDGIKLIQDFRDSTPNNGDFNWNAGLTALNGRKMRYDEMLNEAGRALIKSQLDNDNSVVCFNADAEKYNRYSKIN